jgi:DNA-binding response OmpR family regulator
MAEKKFGHTILIADDELEIRDLLRLYLEKEGYQVVEATDGLDALDKLNKLDIDLAVLDVMMPGLDGFRLLKKLRETNNIPVMILSARIADSDKILGLDLGADDYLTKPFNPLEAVARIQSNLRRYDSMDNKEEKEKEIQVRDLSLNIESCMLYKKCEAIELTSVEYRLMRLFMENPGKVFTKQQLFEQGWGEEFIVADNNIMVCISKLRAKLSADANEYIKNIRGLGYRLEKEI